MSASVTDLTAGSVDALYRQTADIETTETTKEVKDHQVVKDAEVVRVKRKLWRALFTKAK